LKTGFRIIANFCDFRVLCCCFLFTEVIIKECPTPPQVHNGYSAEVSGSDGRIKYVEYFCNNTYILSGDSKRTCQKNGTWSGSQPLCVRGTISSSSFKSIVKYLTLYFECVLAKHVTCIYYSNNYKLGIITFNTVARCYL